MASPGKGLTYKKIRGRKSMKYSEQWPRLVKAIESVPSEKTPPGLALQVKTRIRALQEKKSTVPAKPVFRPRLAFVILAFVAAVGAIALLIFVARPHAPAAQAANRTASPMSRSLKVSLQGAHRVAIAGDFNGWNTQSDTLTATREGFWTITLRLSKGNYQYQYIIDNSTWVPDPDNPLRIDDGFGGYNSGMEL
jgi:hypothetical protein